MNRESVEYKKKIAKDYYMFDTFSQKEIAGKVGVTEQTISKWKEEYKWEELRQETLKTADKAILNHAKLVDAFSKELEKDEPDIDKLTKLNALIEKTQAKNSIAGEIEKVGIAMIQFLEETMPEKRDFYLDFFRSFAEWYDKR